MKIITTMLSILLSANLFAATAIVEKTAKGVTIYDMKLTYMKTSESSNSKHCPTQRERRGLCEGSYSFEKLVKVTLKYRAMGEICRIKQGDEICRMGMVTKFQSVKFQTHEIPSYALETLNKRRPFAKRAKYASLARSLFNVELNSSEGSKVIQVELK